MAIMLSKNVYPLNIFSSLHVWMLHKRIAFSESEKESESSSEEEEAEESEKEEEPKEDVSTKATDKDDVGLEFLVKKENVPQVFVCVHESSFSFPSIKEKN